MRWKPVIALPSALVVILSPWGPLSRSAVHAKDPDTAEMQDVGELLDSDIPDASSNLSVDVDRWVLHDVLVNGLAETRPLLPHTEIDGGMQVEQGQTRERTWRDVLRDALLLTRLRGEAPQHNRVAQVDFDIPLASHPLVDVYIDYFTGRGRWFFGKWLERSQRYVPLMQRVLEEKGLPKDLVYLAMVESGFSAKAYSTAAAAGYWQFIGSTGKLYGLTNDGWIDERRDFIRSTEAAATYLGQLYQQTGDWHLAWASYNAGEGRIRRAMGKYAVHDFWRLIQFPRSLAKETQHYVPKIIAAAIVAKNAERYGFTDLAAVEPLVFDVVQVTSATDLRALASKAHVSLDTLRDLNPAILHDVTPPGRTMQLRVPMGQGTEIASLLQTLPPAQRLTYLRHKVRRGDTLYAIARRYNADLQALRAFNRNSSLLKPGQELIVPAIPQLHRLAGQPARRAPRQAVESVRAASTRRHVVATGETLWSIARQYGVSIDRIRKSRGTRRGSRIAVGEVLEIL